MSAEYDYFGTNLRMGPAGYYGTTGYASSITGHTGINNDGSLQIEDIAANAALFTSPGYINYGFGYTWEVGDIFNLVYKNGNLYVFWNEVPVAAGASLTDSANDGLAGVLIEPHILGDVGLVNFAAGSVISANPPPGPITSGTIFPGPYFGSSLAAAFPNTQGLDFFQVIDEGGNIVWNLNAVGTATVNPSSWTNGTLLGVFEGANFAQAFPNPQQLNVFQIVDQGGFVVFYVDYQGLAKDPHPPVPRRPGPPFRPARRKRR